MKKKGATSGKKKLQNSEDQLYKNGRRINRRTQPVRPGSWRSRREEDGGCRRDRMRHTTSYAGRRPMHARHSPDARAGRMLLWAVLASALGSIRATPPSQCPAGKTPNWGHSALVPPERVRCGYAVRVFLLSFAACSPPASSFAPSACSRPALLPCV